MNSLINRNGSIFRPHYKAILVEKEEYYLNVVNYICQNPVRARIVERCEEYEGSFLNWILRDEQVSQYIYTEDLENYFGGKGNRWFNNSLEAVNSSLESTEMFEQAKENLLGRKIWKEKIIRRVPYLINSDISHKQSYNSIIYSKEKIETIVQESKALNKLDVKIYLLTTYTQMTSREIKELYGLKSQNAVSQRLYRLRKQLQTDKEYTWKIDKIVNTIKMLDVKT